MPKPEKSVSEAMSTGGVEAVVVTAPPPLDSKQLQLFEALRVQIIELQRAKGLEFLKHVGKLLVDGLWDGDASKIDDRNEVFAALCDDPVVKISKSNLWYAVQLQDPGRLFGDAAPHLLPSHQKRLLHVPAERRIQLAQVAVRERLTVEQLEDRIKQARAPAEGQNVRGAKPLPVAAKRFTSLSAAADKIHGVNASDLGGLSQAKARVLHRKAQALRQLLDNWLPEFERELARVGKVE